MLEALRTFVELMRSAKSEKVRLDATTTLLALAGCEAEPGSRAGCVLLRDLVSSRLATVSVVACFAWAFIQ